ncbi:hypothetical protein C7974DRAFT_381692 [Boeremia exigua]|uniref:uncharacterized protein n=1 Tax=Boeremia exigua TaxID=749465 RepID=UPI001E8CFF69|nr:uncharacterized protein C7974DRAFT_381692 [Boeremia exigua]KAH6643510.1 hypothetical protein C7974DRAFT_381692 [Boeremia exigua]
MWRFGDHNPANYTHPELVATWYCAVPFLDPGVRELWIDITPAPVDKRGRPQALLDVFVSEEFSAMRFLNGHVKDVTLLITRIDRHYEGRVRVRLTGRLSTKSLVFVKAVRSQLGRELEYEGTWISADDARRARLGAVVAQETLCTLTRAGGRCAAHTLAWLSGVSWSMKTGIIYVKLAEKGLGYAVMQELKKMGQLRAHIGGTKEGVLVLPPAHRLRRAFQHQVAADLGLQTAEADGKDSRYVIARC